MNELTLRYVIASVGGIIIFAILIKQLKIKEKISTKKRRIILALTILPVAAVVGVLLVMLHSALLPENELAYEISAGSIVGILVAFGWFSINSLLSGKDSDVDITAVTENESDELSQDNRGSVEITDSLKQQIIEIYEREREHLPEKFYLFDNVPHKELENAKKSYATLLHSDEVVIFLYDDTITGNGKKGFILTSKYLFSKSDATEAAKVYVGDINKITQATASKIRYAITVETAASGDTDFIVATTQEKRNSVERILDETISLLKSNFGDDNDDEN
ncbi:MAG: hypothetical protein FWD05_10795 [Oscillospiraceae bacterium]|nr:hypothetical protein [Oscillospiraceae bacterium]